MAVLFWPVMVSLASGAPLVGPYIARWARYNQGAVWAEQKGYLVPVGKSVAANGYAFRVESVVANAARTEVYYTVDGPHLKAPIHPPLLEPTFNLRHPDGGWGGRQKAAAGAIVQEHVALAAMHAIEAVARQRPEFPTTPRLPSRVRDDLTPLPAAQILSGENPFFCFRTLIMGDGEPRLEQREGGGAYDTIHSTAQRSNCTPDRSGPTPDRYSQAAGKVSCLAAQGLHASAGSPSSSEHIPGSHKAYLPPDMERSERVW